MKCNWHRVEENRIVSVCGRWHLTFIPENKVDRWKMDYMSLRPIVSNGRALPRRTIYVGTLFEAFDIVAGWKPEAGE